MIRFALPLTLLLASCGNGSARPDVKPADGWARETVPGQTSAAAYLTLINNGTGADRLVAVSSEAAAQAMVHSTMTSDRGVSRMRHLGDGLAIPAKTAVELTPGRNHIMLTGLKQPLRRGQRLTLELRFERSGTKQAMVKVLDPARAGLQEAR
jgi:copper(I)-binding protein